MSPSPPRNSLPPNPNPRRAPIDRQTSSPRITSTTSTSPSSSLPPFPSAEFCSSTPALHSHLIPRNGHTLRACPSNSFLPSTMDASTETATSQRPCRPTTCNTGSSSTSADDRRTGFFQRLRFRFRRVSVASDTSSSNAANCLAVDSRAEEEVDLIAKEQKSSSNPFRRKKKQSEDYYYVTVDHWTDE